MTDSSIELLSEREREVLRALWRTRRVASVPRELNRPYDTVKAQLAKARRKLGATDSMHAARLLAAAERTDPNGVYPDWAILGGPMDQQTVRAASEGCSVVRDVAGWPVPALTVPPNVKRRRPGLQRVVRDGITMALLLAGLLVILLFLLDRVPRIASPNTFEPDVRPPGHGAR